MSDGTRRPALDNYRRVRWGAAGAGCRTGDVMPLRATDKIMSRRQADPDMVVRRLDRPSREDIAFADLLVEACEIAGVDPILALVQWMLETGNATSIRWTRDLNSSGIGIVSSNTDQPFEIPSPAAAANLHVQTLYSLVNRKLHPGLPLWPEADEWMRNVWLPKVRSSAMPSVNTVYDLGIRYKENGVPRATWSYEDGLVPMDTYGKKLESRGREMYPEADEQVENMAIQFGRVPFPPHRKEIAQKIAPGLGYDLLTQPRKNVGMTWHEWMGNYIPGFFSCPSGERCRNALVDFAILKDGTIIMINDPFGVRSPWASGGGVGSPGGLEGDGPAFVAKFGVSAINGRTVSVEIVKLNNENWTEAQINSGAALAAYFHDQDGQLWSEHPFTSKYGLVTSFLHFEFGTTDCGKGEIDDISRCQAVTKGIMRKYQEGGDSVPIPPDVPPLPAPEIPGGLTLEEAKKRFGLVTKHLPDGTTTKGGFDPKGSISLAWAHRSAEEKVWPACEDWYVLKDSGQPFQIVTFSNDWRLVQVAERAGWQWVAFTAVEQK